MASEFHIHDGNDMDRVRYSDIEDRIIEIPYRILDGSNSTDYGVIYTAPEKGRVIYISEAHKTAGSDAGSVTMQLEKLTDGTASGSGIDLLATAFDLKSTADTIVEKEMIDDFVKSSTSGVLDITFQKGERLGLVTTGTLTAVADVTGTLMIVHDDSVV